MARPTFLGLQERVKYLIGEDGSTGADSTTTGATQKSHINAAIKDIISRNPYSWNVDTTTVTLDASGEANLPADYTPKWQLEDCRIVDSVGYDTVFTHINIPSRNIDDSLNLYWITYDVANDIYVIHSNQASETLTIYYHSSYVGANAAGTGLDDLSADTDVCAVPEQEAVAYLAASKHWISDERNEELASRFQREAEQRISALYIQDLNFGAQYYQGSPTDYEAQLEGE